MMENVDEPDTKTENVDEIFRESVGPGCDGGGDEPTQLTEDTIDTATQDTIRPEIEKSLLHNIEEGTPEADDEGEKVGWSITLTENIYSLIYAAQPNRTVFAFAVTLFLFQASLLILALIDLIDLRNGKNPLNVPPGVVPEVRAAQFLALTLAIGLFGDLLDATEKFQEGYDPSIMKQAPYATCWKWVLAFSLQFSVGVLYLLTTFVIVVQSNAVISMFLNFAALGFIAEVDDLAFVLARKGYFTDEARSTCEDVANLETPNARSFKLRRGVFVLIWVGLMSGFGVVIHGQTHGKFQCKKIYAQFGDEALSVLPFFSGDYNVEPRTRRDGRPIYLDVRSGGRSHFRYCKSESAWVFRYNTSVDDDCAESSFWALKSPATKGFDLTETDPLLWKTALSTRSTLLHNVEYFLLRCNDCDETTCNGDCETNQCVCREGQYGRGCEFDSLPCERIDRDFRTSPLKGYNFGFGDVGLSSEYDLLVGPDMQPVMVYDHAVYFHVRGLDIAQTWEISRADVLVNMGRRYMAFYLFYSLDATALNNATNLTVANSTQLLVDFSAQSTTGNLISYLQSFHGFYSMLNTNVDTPIRFVGPLYMSDPLDYGTASDSLSPTKLGWSRPQTFKNVEDSFKVGPAVDTVLVCDSCSDGEEDCLNGDCVNSTCVCWDGYVGPACEGVESWCEECPLSNGYCSQKSRSCECFDGFEGEFCETEVSPAGNVSNKTA